MENLQSGEKDQVNRENTEMLWKHYQLHIDLYKHYLNLLLQSNIFFYAITGAILSFFFSQSQKEILRYALILPMVMSLLFILICIFGAWQNRHTDEELQRITTVLNFPVFPDVRVLTFALLMFAVFFALIFIGLLLVFINAHLFATLSTK
jgi:hypothetical protein